MLEPCVVCRWSDWELLSEQDRAGQPLRTVLCRRCGLVRHAELPEEEELQAFYRESYRETYHGEQTPSPKRVVRAWRRGKALHRRLAARVPAGGDVLEVGAGLGLNLKPFQLAGARVRGLEPHAGFGAFSRETLCVDVEQGSVDDLQPEPGYDLILFTHVVEHLRDPLAGLERLRAALRPSGLLYLECPNVAAPHALPRKLFHFAHLYDFSRAGLLALAGRAGFVLEESFAPEGDPTVAVLLRPSPYAQVEIDPGNAMRVRRAVHDTSWLSYHLRASYLQLRAVQLRQRVYEALTVGASYRRILRRCGEGE